MKKTTALSLPQLLYPSTKDLTNSVGKKSVTHYRVGADCGFDKSLISRWISKNYLPSLEIAELLADYFKVSLDYLFGRTDYRN